MALRGAKSRLEGRHVNCHAVGTAICGGGIPEGTVRKLILVTLAFLSTAAMAASPGSAAAGPAYPKTAFSTDVSDLWWNPSESGWGMQLVQESNFVFATVFIYGSDGRPTWITGELTAGGGPVFSGPVYVTTGPWFGGTFDPGAVGTRQAGTMTFTLQSAATGVLNYSVDGVSVTKEVQRETLALENYTGDYFTSYDLQSSGCVDPAQNGATVGAMGMNVSQSGTSMSMTWSFSNGDVCTYSGAYGQAGHLGSFAGAFSCNSGDAGNMVLFEMTNRPGTITGRLIGSGTNSGCSYTGFFSGIDPTHPPQ